MAAAPCRLCGQVMAMRPEAVAVVIPVEDHTGKLLDVPGVYFLCLKCRQAIACAERAQREKGGTS